MYEYIFETIEEKEYGLDLIKERLQNGIDYYPKNIEIESVFDIDEVATPLMLAVKYGFTDLVKLFIEEKADVNMKVCGYTALMLSVRLEENSVFNMLVENRADIHIKDDAENNLLIIAASIGNLSLCQMLSEHIDVNDKSIDGYTALMWASINGHNDVIKFLMEKGANINAKNKYGKTALMLASINLNTNTAKILLSLGADITIKDYEGDGVIEQMKKQRGSEETLGLLKSYMPK